MLINRLLTGLDVERMLARRDDFYPVYTESKLDVRFLEWKVPVKYLLLKSICYIFVIKLYEISLESFFFNKCSKFIFFSCYKYFERNKYFCVNRMKGFL